MKDWKLLRWIALLYSSISIMPIASNAYLIELHFLRHPETGKKIVLAGDIHTLGNQEDNEKQAQEFFSQLRSLYELPDIPKIQLLIENPSYYDIRANLSDLDKLNLFLKLPGENKFFFRTKPFSDLRYMHFSGLRSDQKSWFLKGDDRILKSLNDILIELQSKGLPQKLDCLSIDPRRYAFGPFIPGVFPESTREMTLKDIFLSSSFPDHFLTECLEKKDLYSGLEEVCLSLQHSFDEEKTGLKDLIARAIYLHRPDLEQEKIHEKIDTYFSLSLSELFHENIISQETLWKVHDLWISEGHTLFFSTLAGSVVIQSLNFDSVPHSIVLAGKLHTDQFKSIFEKLGFHEEFVSAPENRFTLEQIMNRVMEPHEYLVWDGSDFKTRSSVSTEFSQFHDRLPYLKDFLTGP